MKVHDVDELQQLMIQESARNVLCKRLHACIHF